MDDAGGLVVSSLDTVEEFIGQVQGGDLDGEDRSIHRGHPLVVLLDASLESISKANLTQTIVGFTRRSEARLVWERRKLERKQERPGLQRLLFSFERFCSVIRETGYGQGDSNNDRLFFEESFPAWLEHVEEWAKEEGFDLLAARVSDLLADYQLITGDIVLIEE